MRKNLTIFFLVSLVIMQLIPVENSNPKVESPLIFPDSIFSIVKTSCFDCHSNETVWPWYSHIAPFSWAISHHVKKGRTRFNFSEWEKYSSEKKDSILLHIKSSISKGFMPPKDYLLMHSYAELSEKNRKKLISWIDLRKASKEKNKK
jgi:hypothetical protein